MKASAEAAAIASESVLASSLDRARTVFARMLKGYRFTVCDDDYARSRAFDVRRKVYVEGCGYDVAVPDEYDARSWLLLAENTATREAVGTMRITPRLAGPLEAEEYFRLPVALRSPATAEITRFAVLPPYRSRTRILPVVFAGLVKLAVLFLPTAGIRWLVVCSTEERIWAYTWLNMRRTGLRARYQRLNGVEHELLVCSVDQAVNEDGHRFKESFLDIVHPEIRVPAAPPPFDTAPPPRWRIA